ncbi:MAG: hypothetical protein IPJ30_04020 [Acidobacteria bacterium]|nr:hypothetical protein [Acidobacteriota bacterium]
MTRSIIRFCAERSFIVYNRKHSRIPGFQVPDSKFQIPSSRFQVPDSRFQIPSSRFQIQNPKSKI